MMTVSVVLTQQLGGAIATKILVRPGSGEHLDQRVYMDVLPTSDSS